MSLPLCMLIIITNMVLVARIGGAMVVSGICRILPERMTGWGTASTGFFTILTVGARAFFALGCRNLPEYGVKAVSRAMLLTALRLPLLSKSLAENFFFRH